MLRKDTLKVLQVLGCLPSNAGCLEKVRIMQKTPGLPRTKSIVYRSV